ncbi:MAG: hypothetical protein JWM27_4757 [Gemmatimonadetes bacterium]|nr:hypothetical protein [Gemmatimonadota bacterium]
MSDQSPTTDPTPPDEVVADDDAAVATQAPAGPTRTFSYNSQELAEIDASWTPEQVRDFWAGTYPELANAKIKGPDKKVGADGREMLSYSFVRNVGHLG